MTQETVAGESLFDAALACLTTDDPFEKINATRRLHQRFRQGSLQPVSDQPVEKLSIPGRPARPLLVPAARVAKRGFHTRRGILSLVHAIAHIEFNAINLALDAVYRFRSMPRDYYCDWLQVAVEESDHFLLLNGYLEQHDMHYGDLCAHNGLWEMAVRTDFDVLVRMALVPRVLEARGLDVTPGMIDKLQKQGESELVAILQRIFDDEIGHVKIGSHWFRYLCQQRGLPADATFADLLDRYMRHASFGPYDLPARRQAGFSEAEIRDLLARR